MNGPLSRSPTALCPANRDVAVPNYVSIVLESRSFQNAPALRTLLLFLWQNRDEQISEYAIATEALGRSSLFSAKTDATVRVQISRLRQRLEKFYDEEGRGSGERLTIPLGSHQLSVEPRVGMEEEVDTGSLRPKPASRKYNYAVAVLTAGCGILFVSCVILALKLHDVSSVAKPAAPKVASLFWKSFYSNGLPTQIILPTPVFFSYASGPQESSGTVMVRDTNLNDFSKRSDSGSLRLFGKFLGQPTLAQNYTVTSDTFAGVKLVRYLDGYQFPTTVHSSADAVLESLDSENLIAIGTWGTLSPFAPYLDKMSFKLASHEDSVEIRNPSPSEPRLVPRVSEAVDRTIWPGIIAILPGENGRSHLLVIGGRQTSSLVSFLTCTNGLAQLEQIWRAKGSPDFYEVIVCAEVNGNNTTPVRFWPVALHSLKYRS